MHIKVRGGTVQHGQTSLCATCKYATVVKGRSLQEEIVECAQLSGGHGRIRFPVTYCTEHLDRNHPSIREMVTFSPEADWSLIDHVTMESELSKIIGRKVDLVSRRAVERSGNWIRREAILQSAEPFFGAR